MARFLALMLLAASACEAPPPPFVMPATRWVYPPAPLPWPVPPARGSIGRSQAPQSVVSLGIAGSAALPLRLPTTWQVPGEGAARVAVYGLEGTKPAIELIDIDAGRVLWRDTATCAGPIVGVTEDAIVCADAAGVRGVTLDGKAAWRSEMPFVAMTDERVMVGPTGQAVILEPASGDELSRVTLPAGVIAETIVASCGDAGRELFAATMDRTLVRIVDAPGGSKIAWSAPAGGVVTIEACTGDSVLVREDETTLSAFARGTGQRTGRVENVRGFWPARDGSAQLEVATASGVAVWPRDLSAPTSGLVLPALGELIASRGERRLVRATEDTMVLLDRAGVAAYLPLVALGAALGTSSIVAASWRGSDAESVRRSALPPRYRRTLRLSPAPAGVTVPAELRDRLAPTVIDPASAVVSVADGKLTTPAFAIDPATPQVVYAVAADNDESEAAIVAFDLAGKQVAWRRDGGCGVGLPVAIVVAAEVVACSARDVRTATSSVTATTRAGVASWRWTGASVETLAAAGSVIVVSSGDRAEVLDAATGRVRLRLASDSGARLPIAAVEDPAWGVLVISAEHGWLVARAAVMDFAAVWSLSVHGVVTAVHGAGDRVVVELADGDAYVVQATDGTATALPAIGVAWSADADVIASSARAARWFAGAIPDRVAVNETPAKGKAKADDEPRPPRLWRPIDAPPDAGPTYQLVLYEPAGGVRARNDYALDTATPGTRGPTGSAFTLRSASQVLVLDPMTGNPLRAVALQTDGIAPVFSTLVNGAPVVGAALGNPLRIVLF